MFSTLVFSRLCARGALKLSFFSHKFFIGSDQIKFCSAALCFLCIASKSSSFANFHRQTKSILLCAFLCALCGLCGEPLTLVFSASPRLRGELLPLVLPLILLLVLPLILVFFAPLASFAV
jgi:hypothetical protein